MTRMRCGSWLVAVMLVANCCHCDQSSAADKAKAAAKKPAKSSKLRDRKDPYALPKSRVKDLVTFINELMELRPTNDAERQEQREKVYPAVLAAAERLSEIATDKEKKLKGYRDAMGAALYVGAMQADTVEEVNDLVEALAEQMSATGSPSLYEAKAAHHLATQLERARKGKQAALVNHNLGEMLAASKDAEIAKIGNRMVGTARRMTLVGQPLKVTGTPVGGGKFNWSKYRGKVVLIDFWATWCGPCKAELPNVLRNYQLYHDRGFDVVGISLDENKAALKQFLTEQEIPWTTLNNGDWDDNAMADYYGISSIPTVFLVNQEGTVISLNARGDELGRQLEALLGPAELAGN